MRRHCFYAVMLCWALLSSGCVIYLDRPDVVTLKGVVVWDSDGAPVKNGHVRMLSTRKYLPTPGLSRIPAGYSVSDEEGRFTMTVKNRWPAEIYANDVSNTGFGTTMVRSEEFGHVVIRLTKRAEPGAAANDYSCHASCCSGAAPAVVAADL
jgi:hypothetical protein